MPTTVNFTQSQGAAYSWSGANYDWDSPQAGRSWDNAYAIAYSGDIGETVAVSELGSREVTKRAAEGFFVAEALNRSIGIAQSETIGFAETYVDYIEWVVAISESLGIGEILGKEVSRPVAEAFAFAETLGNQTTLNKFESFATGDQLARAFGLAKSESFSTNEALAKAIQIVESEAFAFADAVARQFDLSMSEAFAVLTAIAKHTTIPKSESFAVAEQGRRQITKQAFETVALADELSRALDMSFSEAIGFAESYIDFINYVLSIVENLSFTETPSKEVNKPFAEAFDVAETSNRIIGKNILRALAFGEAFGRTVEYRRNLNEGLTIADALSRAFTLTADEALSVFDAYVRSANGVISDMMVKNVGITELDFAQIIDAGHPAGYTDFRDFIQGDYTYQKAIYRAILESASADRGVLEKFQISVDLPDVVDKGTVVITNAASGISVVFDRVFYVPPEVTITHKGGVIAATPKIVGTVTKTGFTAILQDASGANVTGTISWIAQGY